MDISYLSLTEKLLDKTTKEGNKYEQLERGSG